MNEKTENYIPIVDRGPSKVVGDVAKNFADECIADIFCVWDCCEKRWVKDSPVLIRFETDDLLIEGPAGLYEGAVDTTVICDVGGTPYRGNECFCWLPTNHLSAYVGESFKEAELVSIIGGFATQVADRWHIP